MEFAEYKKRAKADMVWESDLFHVRETRFLLKLP